MGSQRSGSSVDVSTLGAAMKEHSRWEGSFFVQGSGHPVRGRVSLPFHRVGIFMSQSQRGMEGSNGVRVSRFEANKPALPHGLGVGG